MTPPDELTLVENALRSLIEDVLRERFGDSWEQHVQVSEDRKRRWSDRRQEARKSATGGIVESRLLFYADFTDLWKIIGSNANWDLFKPCFHDKKRLEVYLNRLAVLRNPAAHSRSLLPFEESLIIGMSGEIRQMITLFRNGGGAGPEPEHFARIEEVTDSYGHRGTGRASGEEAIDTRNAITLRPGENVTFRGTARDPKGRPLKWKIRALGIWGSWDRGVVHGESFEVEWTIRDADVHEQQEIDFTLSSGEGPHRYGDYDDMFRLIYKVLPAV